MAGNTEKRIKAIYELDSTGFNKGLKGINTELKGNKEQLKLASAGIQAFGKDSERLKGTQDALTRQVELTSKKMDLYKQSIEKTTTQMQSNITKRDQLKDSLDSANKKYYEAVKIYGKESVEAKKAKEEVERLTAEHKKSEAAVESNAKKIINYDDNLTKANTEMVKAQGELNKITKELKEQDSKWISAGKSMQEHGEKLQESGKKMSSVGKTLTKSVTLPIVGIGAAALKAEIDWESSFAGVKKTVDGTTEQIKGLETGIKNMSKELPSSASEIAAVAESAGQLGIETDSILGFTKVIIDLGNATNLVGEEGASQLAKFANITKMSQKDFDRLGSTIVDLGNNSATTEADIVSMGMRLAGAGKQVGMSEAEIMSFAAALSSVGIEAEAGGTAFSKVMLNMQMQVQTNGKQLEKYGKVAGMSGQEFKKAFEQDATGALIKFIEGLGKLDNKATVLEGLKLSGIQVRDSLLRASGAGDLFNQTLEVGTKAWEENTALTNEASQRYETTESQIKILRNEIVDLARDLGKDLLPMAKEGLIVAKDVIGRLKEMSPETRQNIIKFGLLAAAVGPVVGGLGALVGGFGTVIKVGGGMAKALGAAKLGTEAVGAASGIASAGGVASLTGGLGAIALAALPWVAGAAAVAGAGYLIHKQLTKETIPTVDLFADKVVMAGDKINGAEVELAEGVQNTTLAISEATKESVGSYMAMDRDVGESLYNMKNKHLIVTDEMATELTGKFDAMGQMIISKSNEKYEAMLTDTKTFFAENNSLTDEEEAEVLAKMDTNQRLEQGKIKANQDEITRILNLARDENRSNTETEVKQMEMLKMNMKDDAVRVLSETEQESNIIRERLKEHQGRINAEMASEIMTKAFETRNKSIQASKDQYEGVVKNANTLLKAGTINQEQYDKMVKDAQGARDDSIKSAEQMAKGVMEEIVAGTPGIELQVNTQTGKIMSAYDKVKLGIKGIFEWLTGKNKQAAKEASNISYGGGGNNKARVEKNWTGNNHFMGGLTTLHEKGEEIYQLERGTKIYNAERSEQMAMNAAEKVAEKVASRLLKGFNPNQGAIDQTMVAVFNLDGREIARATARPMSQELSRLSNNSSMALGGA